MLSLHPQPGKLRYANHLLPTAAGGLATRPGATQIVAGDIAHAAPWGNRLMIEKLGRLRLWDGLTETDIAPAGFGLQATPFQALTSAGAREERLYVADGVNALWYVARVSGAYGRYELDRQCTALREGIEAANRLADPAAVVAVPRQLEDVRPYARPDLRLIADGDFRSGADFVLTCSWPDEEDLEPGGLRRVYTVRRGEAVLDALWQR